MMSEQPEPTAEPKRTRRWHPLFSLAAVIVVLAVAVVGSVVWLRDDRPKTEAEAGRGATTNPSESALAGPRAYAYASGAELVIQIGKPEPIRVPGEFATGVLFWTHTGGHVVATTSSTTGDRFLTAVDVGSGETQRVQCACWSAAPVSGDRIAYVNGKTREAFVLNLANGQSEPLSVTLPKDWKATEVMASGGDTVLVRTQLLPAGADTPEYSSPDVLYAVRVGNPAPIKVTENAFIVSSSAVGGTAPDGSPRFGITVPDDDGRCNSATYTLFDGSTGTVSKPPKLLRSANDEDAWMTITDWWWDENGALFASLSSHRCTDTTDEEMTAPPSLWRLDRTTWTNVDRTTAHAVRPLGPDSRLLLVRKNEVSSYALMLDRGAETTKVADEVANVAVAPAKPQPRPSVVSSGTTATIDGQRLRQAGVCKVPCEVVERIQFDHPDWGPTTLVTTKARGDDVDANIAAVDRSGRVRWSHWGGDWTMLALNKPARDKTGHLFLNYNPGRHNGVIVLAPAPNGMEDFDTLPPPGDYNARFYGGELKDVDSDGTYEIEHAVNDCEPNCADGTVRRTVYRWNGTDYA